MTPPADLLVAWIVRQTSLEAIAWFNAKRADLAIDSSPRAFASIFGSVVRRMGKGGLALDASDLAAAEKARPKWRPNGLTGDQAARIVLLLDAARTAERFAERVEGLAASADLGELVAIYKGLPLYPDPDTLVPVAAEGLRTSMRPVFEAVAHQNPFPAENFPQSAWNHMVLKTLFIVRVLHPIIGLDDKWNDELAGILLNYAHERWAAHRPVAPELWRGVGAFADAIADLARVLVEGDPLAVEPQHVCLWVG
jgi:hypothetical protein